MTTPKEKREKKVRIALVGCGRIADLQCLGYLEHPRAEISAVCDPIQERAETRAQEWGARHVYTNLQRLLKNPAIDAVDILTPHHLHAAQAIAVLEAGKHLSLQKPPALSLEEFDHIAKAAKNSGTIFRVFENFMYYPPLVKARELIKKGAVGTPVSIRIKTAVGNQDRGWQIDASAQKWRGDLKKSGGGPLTFDHGYHCFNMARFFIPADIDRVHAFINWKETSDKGLLDGPALISWSYSGKTARYGSWEVIDTPDMAIQSKYYVSDDRVRIQGTKGIIWINRCSGTLLEEPAVKLYRDNEVRSFHHLPVDWSESFRLGGRDFIDAILNGKKPPQQVKEARKTLAFALAAAKSAAEKREVSIKEIG